MRRPRPEKKSFKRVLWQKCSLLPYIKNSSGEFAPQIPHQGLSIPWTPSGVAATDPVCIRRLEAAAPRHLHILPRARTLEPPSVPDSSAHGRRAPVGQGKGESEKK